MHPMQQLYDAPLYDPSRFTMDEAALRRDIPVLMAAHGAVKAALEAARLAKVLGSSLQSSVVITAEGPVAAALERYASELDAMFVVSSVGVNAGVPEAAWAFEEVFEVAGVQGRVMVLPPGGHKCGRCWRYLAVEEEGLCGRCDDVVKGV